MASPADDRRVDEIPQEKVKWSTYVCLPCVCVTFMQVVKSLQEMYDRHKGSYGWQDRPLSIE